jgi:AsmA protein
MAKRVKRIILRVGLGVLGLIVVLLLIPFLFPNAFAGQIKNWANKSIDARLNFSSTSLSFFRHFPNLTLTLHDFSLTGSAPFEKDTLAAGTALGMGIDLWSVFGKSVKVNKFFFDEARVKILVDEKGGANYNIIRPSTSASTDTASGNSAAVRIEGIYLDNCYLLYDDRSIPLTIEASELDYEGKGDLQSNAFDLKSSLLTPAFTLRYDGVNYLKDKKLKADLITSINTDALSIRFRENDLLVNKLPIDFFGSTTILKDGYDIDLNVISGTTDFGNIFSILPPAYSQWFSQMQLAGKSKMTFSMKGAYRAATGQQPDIRSTLYVSNGSIKHKDAPGAMEKLDIRADFSMPALDLEQMTLNLDTFHFQVDNSPARVQLAWKGYTRPQLNANMDAGLNLDLLKKAIAFPGYDFGGKLRIKATANGTVDWAAHQLPLLNATCEVENGHIKTPYYPNALENIAVSLTMQSAKGSTSDLAVVAQPVSFRLDGKPFALRADLRNFDNLAYNLTANGTLDLGKIYQVFAIDNYNLTGEVDLDVKMKGTQADAMAGRLGKLDNQGTLHLKQLAFTSSLYPGVFRVPQGRLEINQDKLLFSQFLLNYGSNEMKLDGYARNLAAYYLQNGTLEASYKLTSERISLHEFMPTGEDDEPVKNTVPAKLNQPPPEDGYGLVLLPDRMNVSLNGIFREVQFDSSTVHNLTAALQLNNGSLSLKNARCELAGAKLATAAVYEPVSSTMANFKASFKADSFNVKKAYNEVPLFREMAGMAKGVEGLISIDYSLQGRLDSTMMPVMPSLRGEGQVVLENVKAKGVKLFGAISKATNRDSVNNPNLKAVVIKSRIANNLITIERTRMRVFGFRPRLEGEISLDRRLNLKGRLGLPPFGIIGIPLSITGTSESPKVKIRKAKEGDDLEEKMDE